MVKSCLNEECTKSHMLLCIIHGITNIVHVINGDTHSYKVTIVIRK